VVKRLEAAGALGLSGPMFRIPSLLIATAAAMMAVAAPAEDSAKIPYWASIRAGEINMRVGPGEDYRILWVYHRQHLPLKVLRVKEGWRLVRDPDGAEGWVLARFLTRERGGFIKGDGPAEMRAGPGSTAQLNWRLAPGVVGLLGDCAKDWCLFTVGERRGYVPQDRIWGAGEP